MIDMTSACARTADLLHNIGDEHLAGPTPCADMTVAALVSHLGGLAAAFTAAAAKQFGELTDTPPEVSEELDDDWHAAYPKRLAELAAAWREPSAWQGMSRAGGVDFPADVGGLIALTEVVVHGWDLARATGQPYAVEDAVLEAVLPHVTEIAEQGPVEGLFAAPVPVGENAPLPDRVIALTGRDPGWTP
ncbi:TIGR03086 family metal-binding protein [Mycolicibacterium psychrotolerans]|uniref:TIGR03086 family protein n=1 Tax=Mycolicibacterium psychrotolerans TaxID=216929 RepID=A0A7I7M8P0_9MYCO|nr:TIGR03086 family metal-binding protein [Mycolicibacterium psychrotolerans]BBX67729.1 TIGR03086 family protein [Mycolicibacterium psychrotolerans]